jgi:imidazolonepropionase-like amidohydrolase
MHCVALVASIALAFVPTPRRALADDDVVAFVDVTLLPMDRPGALPHRTVVVRGDRIDAVGAAAEVAIPPGATRIEGAGRFLLPGLIDDHIHLFDARDLLLYLAHGVTTVRNLKGDLFHLDLREAVRRGERIGPRYLTSGPYLNEPYVKTPDEVEAAARAQADAGYDCLKIHGALSKESFTRLVEVGEEVGLPVVGHVPRNLELEDVLTIGGMAEIAHAEELLYTHFDRAGHGRDARQIEAAVALVKKAGVRVSATLEVYGGIADQVEDLDRVLARPETRLLPPLSRRIFERDLNEYPRRFTKDDVAGLRRNRDFLARVVKALHEAGVPILLGTDAMVPCVVPGASVLRELEALVAAGLPPWDALAAATVRSGDLLALSPPIGRVAPGAGADLLLLEADPLADVRNVGKRAGVMARGRWFPEAELASRLDAQLAGYERERPLAKLVDPKDPAPLLAAARAQQAEPGAAALDENFLNALGLVYVSARAPKLAVDVFAANLELHPGSALARKRLDEARALAGR